MNENTYKIVISVEGGGNQTDNTVKKAKKEKEPKPWSAEVAAKGALILATAKKAVDFSMTSIEMYTGNSVAQRQANAALGAGLAIYGFATNPTATVAFWTVNTATNLARATNENKWETRRAEQMARRSGNYLSTTTR